MASPGALDRTEPVENDRAGPRAAPLRPGSLLARRQVLKGAATVGLVALVPHHLVRVAAEARAATGRFLVFGAHEAGVIEDATARLVPGPTDDPAEAGHPGAREAQIVRYLDIMLGAFYVAPAKVFAGGPFSDRDGSSIDDMATFLSLSPVQRQTWAPRLMQLRRQYRQGVQALDGLSGGDFTRLSGDQQDNVLAHDPDGFVTQLFGDTIEGMYAPPEYGGNFGLVGWRDIEFPGDAQPRGYTPAEVSRSDGPDIFVPTGIALQLLDLLRSISGT